MTCADRFIEENRKKPVHSTSENSSSKDNIGNVNRPDVLAKTMNTDVKHTANIKHTDSTTFDTYSLMGPVVKLPVETKIVMRFTAPPPCQHHLKKSQKTQSDVTSQKTKSDVTNKIDAACCMDSACTRRLAELEQAADELRSRAGSLARREAERVALLERAEAGWRDLELGYQRRLALADEKENDLAEQIKKSIEERNSCKSICTNLAETLKERGAAAEKERERLKSLEREVCKRACVRLRLSEESARGDAALAEQLCRVSQLDRDLQFKEEQARRKVRSLESELESFQCLTYEAERAMRFELSALKDQVTNVSKKLLAEEDINNSIKADLEQYRHEKANIIEDLDGCKDMCENRMKPRMDTLTQKREQLKELKERVMDCQCKLPLDAAVEAKRTASLAALCRCTPEDRLLESCSCTSLRSQLLSNLLADLFGGLQAELSTSGLEMPCGLLLCLDDRHNWDRSSAVKTNLRNFFAQLLVGELDIAIATSIENYHAKWVGVSCADKARLIPDPGEEVTEGWEQRAIERRALKLATKLAEQLFEERAEELKQRAKEVVASGPPPCECKDQQPAVYSCLVKTPAPATNTAHKNGDVAPSYMRRTMQDVIHLKHQIEDLKKESIKKEDLRQMEEKIAKIIRRAAKVDNSPRTSKNIKCIKHNQQIIDGKLELCDDNGMAKKKDVDISNLKKNVNNSSINPLARAYKNSNKTTKKLEQSFAVNLCLCSDKEAPRKLAQAFQRSNNLKAPRDLVTNIPSIKQTKPINTLASTEKNNPASKLSIKTVCPSDCICFHTIPSNSSIDKLLEILSKWNGSLSEILEDTKLSSNQIENGNKSLLLDAVYLETNKKDKNELSKSVHQTRMSNQFSKEDYSKEECNNNKISENVLPPTIESEYLGAINLDKSNYNICRCPVNNDMKIMHGDSKMLPDSVPFQCINADVCKCKSSVLSEQLKETKHYEYVPSKIKEASHAYSVELDKVQFKCTETETDSLNKKNSTKSVEVSEDTFIQDVVRQSQLFPNNCDYFVKFLGVTLTNSSSTNKTKHDHDNNTLKTSSKVTKNKDKNTIKEGSSNIKTNDTKSSELSSSLENCENTDLDLDCLTKVSSRVLDTNKDACVCCNNKETSKDLELNAFKLLEEHIKRKLEELLRSSSKSSCLPPEEENKLFNTILFKVKEVISESTKSLSCKCREQSTNEGSWSRAYGMLQEYLKVKIKRVQCSCVESLSDGNVESILPPILKKVCDLIENDFQRLKVKCKCDNDDEKLNKTSFIKNNISSTEKFNIIKNTDEETTKCVDNNLQTANCIPIDKSCEVLENSLLNLSTSEKKMSCEFKIYGTKCNCQHMFTESSGLQKANIVNQCTNLQSLNVIDTLSTSEIQHPLGSSIPLKKCIHLNKHNEGNVCFFDCTKTESKLKAKIPYIGYTLSSKSLVQNNTDKIDCIWKSFTGKRCPKKCSYIMDKVLTNIKSENNIHHLPSYSCGKNTHNIEVDTFDNAEDLVLKCSNDKDTNKTFDETSAGTKNKNIDNSSCIDECELHQLINDNNYDIDDIYNTKFLYDSLHLPTPRDTLTKQFENGNVFDDIFEKKQDKCDCKMVPICHVKMLVNSIEKKLIQSKCTCDSLNSQVCPVHSLEV